MYKLSLIDKENNLHFVNYDQHTSKLTLLDGTPAVDWASYPHGLTPVDWSKNKHYVATSPDSPTSKSPHIKRLKIQMGLGCNYSCSYCLQGAQIHKAAASNTSDVIQFLENIDEWLVPDALQKIEIWGGEPLLYWKKILELVPPLKLKYPDVQFSMITNGTLLTKEKVDQLYDWNFRIAISHDGPGQSIRGADPFKNKQIFEAITYAYEKFGSTLFFNAVLTSNNCDVDVIIDWFKGYFPDCNVGFEGVVHDYNGKEESKFTVEKLEKFSLELVQKLISGSAMRSPTFVSKMRRILDNFVLERPSEVIFQKCGMDQEDQIAVDLKGNVTTCQNTGGNGEHKIGHVKEFDKIALNTSYHWSIRKECSACPVLQLCQGGCMYQTGENWVNSCNAEFYYNMAFFAAALYFITGQLLVGYDGNIIRPTV